MLNISGFSFLPPPNTIKYCNMKGTQKGPISKTPKWVPFSTYIVDIQ
jgi:hypothetical protein